MHLQITTIVYEETLEYTCLDPFLSILKQTNFLWQADGEAELQFFGAENKCTVFSVRIGLFLI